MTDVRRSRLVVAALLLLGSVTFGTGINWGLPSREVDPYLFGSAERAWSAARIVAEGGAWTPDAGRAADADADPIAGDRAKGIVLNATDRQRAEIIRRYRLFSAQPDEMVTFMSLAGMRGGRFDPRMYQYGGLWIYPVGGLLKVASFFGGVTLRADLNYYLDRPEEFARFYIVARAYSAAWGLVGIWAVFALLRRLTGGIIWPATAGACLALMPIVINGAHEAKPHLAGTVLVLLAALAGARFVEKGGRRWWMLTGALCGLAAGVVLSAAVAFVVIPLVALLRPTPWTARLKLMASSTSGPPAGWVRAGRISSSRCGRGWPAAATPTATPRPTCARRGSRSTLPTTAPARACAASALDRGRSGSPDPALQVLEKGVWKSIGVEAGTARSFNGEGLSFVQQRRALGTSGLPKLRRNLAQHPPVFPLQRHHALKGKGTPRSAQVGSAELKPSVRDAAPCSVERPRAGDVLAKSPHGEERAQVERIQVADEAHRYVICPENLTESIEVRRFG